MLDTITPNDMHAAARVMRDALQQASATDDAAGEHSATVRGTEIQRAIAQQFVNLSQAIVDLALAAQPDADLATRRRLLERVIESNLALLADAT
jgi:hypothetical protein